MIEFEGVVTPLATALNKRGYSKLTSVQDAVIEPELAGTDMLVSAQTGSGKTVAFGVAIAPTLLEGADKLPRGKKPLALVIAPTRELALQVKRELEWLYEETGAIIASCVGGMDMRTERRTLERGAHIVVGTPGRLRDHIMRKSLNPTELRAVILDEADEMLDLGFKDDLEFILETTPEDRRTLMFSATVPASIGKLAKNYQNDAVRVSTSEESKQHVDIEYRALTVTGRERENAIINVLRYYEAKNALVFCNTRASVNHLVSRFNNRGFSVVALSGELSQSERTHALQAMRDGRARVCIATDVAARGIDLPNLELVIHAELPSNPETLLHRSGRTGRAGRKGVSALIVDHKTRKKAERILRFAKINATWAAPPSATEVIKRDEERIMEDPILTDPILDEEKEFVEKLMENHTAEQLAAAFVRLGRAGKSAPEELQNVPVNAPAPYIHDGRPERGERKPREEFKNSIWFSLSVGRKQNAEPRWLIPLLCNAGDITKADIGVIKMQTDETYIQLNADNADDFFTALGPNQTLEKNIRVTRIEGTPKIDTSPYSKPKRSFGDKKPHRKGGPDKRGNKGEFADKKPWEKKKDRKPKGDDFNKDDRGEKKPYKGKKSYDGSKPTGDTSSKKKRKFGPVTDEPYMGKEKKSKAKASQPTEKKEGWAKKKSKAPFKGKKPRQTGPAKKT
ncbi:MAG: DEAD/DEAH box helicase [Rhizobiaceae bacterium]